MTEPKCATEAMKSCFGAQKQSLNLLQVPDVAVPGPLGLNRQLSQNEDQSDSNNSDTLKSDKCIVCHLMYPREKTWINV